MHKDIKVTHGPGFFRVPVHGLPPLSGWALKHLSGMEDAGIKKGFWMSQWSTTDEEAFFNFEPNLHMVFNEESQAVAVSNALRELQIETEVVKITPPSPTGIPLL